MRTLFGSVAILVLMGLVTLQSQADDKKADKDKLEGTWELSSIEFSGMKIDLPKGKEMSLTFKEGKVVKKEAGKKDEDGTYKIDDSKKPHEIDITTPKDSDPKVMETNKAIFDLDGDSLKIGFGGKPDAPRPSAFDAKDVGILNFKRVKK